MLFMGRDYGGEMPFLLKKVSGKIRPPPKATRAADHRSHPPPSPKPTKAPKLQNGGSLGDDRLVVETIFERFSGRKGQFFRCRDLDSGPCRRIATISRGRLFDLKLSKARQ
jgi:hypothetical protein